MLSAKSMTKTQLVDENIRLRAECERLDTALTAALNYVDALKKREAKPSRTTRPVFEFNPNVVGDFARATKLAKEQGGSVRRAQR